MQNVTKRDNEVLLSIYRNRLLTTTQIKRLHFPSKRTAQRRLALLKKANLVEYYEVQNIGDRLYTLSSYGVDYVAQLMSEDRDELLRPAHHKAPKDYYFIKHLLAICDFRIALELAAAKSDISLLGFIPEYYGKKYQSGRVKKYVTDVALDSGMSQSKIRHTPDAVFALEKRGIPALFFLEVDRGTETISNSAKGVAKLIRFYEAYAHDGKYSGYSKEFGCSLFRNFRLLLTTTTQRRINNIRNALGSEPNPLHKFFWLTTIEEIKAESIFEDLWVSLDLSDASKYQIQ